MATVPNSGKLNYRCTLLTKLALADDLALSPPSKYGHFQLQKIKMATAKIQTQGFKTAVHKLNLTEVFFIYSTSLGI